MLQAIANASIIWLCSLLVYELLLKGETFHRWNRFYLLLTFIAGIVLPLLPLGQTVSVTSSGNGINENLLLPAGSASTFPGKVGSSAEAATASNDLWLALYFVGALGTALYLIGGLLRLWTLYRRSAIHKEGAWTVAETGGNHSPFSFLRTVFVSRIDQYTRQQWRMILQHEQQHYSSRHVLDLVLLHLAMVLLWFHPAVYIYRHKLRVLHEYEADSVRQEDVVTYGSFLLEQAIFPPPVLTHALSFSPLKNRIRMMTKIPSGRGARYRLFLLLPMMSLFIWRCTAHKPDVAIDIKGRYAMLHGAGLGYPKAQAADTVVFNSDTGAGGEPAVVVMESVPEKLGGQRIAEINELRSRPDCVRPGSNFSMSYILQKAGVTSTLQKMNDGAYFMAVFDLIVDGDGHVVYYALTFPENQAEGTPDPARFFVAKPSGLSEADKEELQKKIAGVLIGGSVAFAPSQSNQGKKVPYFLESNQQKSGFDLQTTVTVKDHKVTTLNQPL